MSGLIVLITIVMVASTFVPRIYWKWRFNRLNAIDKFICRANGVDYESLIRRGLL